MVHLRFEPQRGGINFYGDTERVPRNTFMIGVESQEDLFIFQDEHVASLASFSLSKDSFWMHGWGGTYISLERYYRGDWRGIFSSAGPKQGWVMSINCMGQGDKFEEVYEDLRKHFVSD